MNWMIKKEIDGGMCEQSEISASFNSDFMEYVCTYVCGYECNCVCAQSIRMLGPESAQK